MVAKLLEHASVRLLKHIVRCYLRLSEHPKYVTTICIFFISLFSFFFLFLLVRAREALRLCLPEALTDQSFGEVIKTEEAVQRWLASLLKNLSDKSNATLGSSGTSTASVTSVTSATNTVTISANGTNSSTNVTSPTSQQPAILKPNAPQNPFSAQGTWQNIPTSNNPTS